MKHLVTISLVFFSLTHLAKAERLESLRILNEQYCNEHKINLGVSESVSSQQAEEHHPYLLSYTKLALIGTQPNFQAPKYVNHNQVIADLTIRKKPKNNSP
ncbi:hypothetical protein [Pedobacter sp. MW01-1-1]|uniref:hypothetical protein n=1 Tax=Pedobacter sp. MW01-1-1 TaxID=3383027 RepID=UPI003FEE6F7C